MDEDAIVKFCEESGLPVALDETVDHIQDNPVKELAKYVHPGIVAIVSACKTPISTSNTVQEWNQLFESGVK